MPVGVGGLPAVAALAHAISSKGKPDTGLGGQERSTRKADSISLRHDAQVKVFMEACRGAVAM